MIKGGGAVLPFASFSKTVIKIGHLTTHLKMSSSFQLIDLERDKGKMEIKMKMKLSII